MFICTANDMDRVPGPLRDRMEVITLAGYTAEEKLQIAKRYLVPRQIERNGLKRSQVAFSDAGLKTIVADYTREAGVRSLEREIGSVCRKVAVRVAMGTHNGKVSVTAPARTRAARPPALPGRRAPPHRRAGRRHRARLDAGRRRRAVRGGDGDARQGQARRSPASSAT